VHGIGQHDIHYVDVGIIGDTVEVLVIIDILARDIVFVRPDLLLGGSAGDNGGEAALFFVFCSAGAIWLVLKLPRPTSAKPSRLSV
jgi:hypothetical protein